MTLQETERRHHQSNRKTKQRRRRQSDRDRASEGARRRREQARKQALHQGGEHAVLTFLEWCALNGFSPATGRRIINSDAGPIVTQLSVRRLGVTIGNNRRWQELRAR